MDRGERMMRPAIARRDLTRRRFLRLAGSAAAGALLYPLASPLHSVRAQPPASTPPRRVLIEDLTLGPGDFTPSAAGGLVSPVLRASTPFTHIGVHWSTETLAGAALGFEVRSSTDGVGWTPWEAVSVEVLGRETPSGETFGALVSADRASRVQLRVALGPGGATPALGGVTVTLLNAIDGPAIETTAAASTVTIDGLTVVTREGWGGEDSLRFEGGDTSNPDAEIWPRMYVPTKKAVVHHTATGNSYVDGAAEVRAIYTYHAVSLGWGDIGYSSLVDVFGNIYEGRHGRGAGDTREVLSADVVAGHALSHNYGTTGVGLIGTHTARGEGGKPGVVPTSVSWAALTNVLAFECVRRGMDPEGAGDFLRSDDAWNRGLANVPGHRDCNATICPGGHVYDRLGELRAGVAAALASGVGAGPSVSGLTGPTSHPVTDGLASYDWTNDGTSTYQYYLEGWNRLPGSEDIDYLRPADYDPDVGPAWADGGPPASFDGLDDGHYTLHVRARDASGVAGYEATHTLRMANGEPSPANTAPVVTIDAPADGATFDSGSSIEFAGSASDAEDGDLTADLVWTSDLDGPIGTGGNFTAVLTDGAHVITASATDSAGTTASDQVSVTVSGGSSNPIALTANGYKIKGRQKADLEWSSATSAQVDIFRDGALIATVPNEEGTYTDDINERGSGSYSYQVCETGTSICSNEATVTF